MSFPLAICEKIDTMSLDHLTTLLSQLTLSGTISGVTSTVYILGYPITENIRLYIKHRHDHLDSVRRLHDIEQRDMELQRQASYLKHRERDLKRMEEQLRLKGEVLRAREAAQERIENRLKRDIVPSACLQHRCPTYSSLYSRQSVPVIYAPRITVQNNASHCNGAYGSYASSSTYERYGRSDQYDGGGYIELDEKTVYSQESGVQDGSPYCSGDEEAFYSQEPGIQNGSPYSSDDEEAVHSQKPSIIEEDQDIESSASSATGEAIGDVNEQDAGAESGYDAPFSSGSEQEYDGYSDGGGGYGDDYDDYDNEEDCWSDGS